MTTVADIIGLALLDAGIVGEGQTPSPEQSDTALKTLNEMLSLWQLSAFPGLILPEYDSVALDLNLPREFEAPMRYNLSPLLCAAFSAPLRADLASLAKSSLRTLKRFYMQIPQLCIPVELQPRRYYNVTTGTWLASH